MENGEWDKGANVPEAKRVVDLLGEILARPKPPTVGIVTFNLSQRRAILDEIDARRAADENFNSIWDTAASRESLDERPFVKNLESVQGDERELILFSLGYAPVARKRKDGTEDTYVPARFGPLGQKGGERRLNVAVSRAKSEIIVVSSFEPSMLSVAHTKHDGPRFFKAFVEFARHLGEGRRTQAEKILSLINDRRSSSTTTATGQAADHLPLHHQIALALEKEGLTDNTGANLPAPQVLLPRQQMLSVPYALNGTPAGAILPYAGTVPPPGFLMCDGRSYNKVDYPALAAVLNTTGGAAFGGTAGANGTFNTPDLRGRFLRGADDPDGTGSAYTNAGRDPDSQTSANGGADGKRYASAVGGNLGNLVGSVQGFSTARPTNSFSTGAGGEHAHGISLYSATPRVANRLSVIGNTNGSPVETAFTNTDGTHSHTISQGGDAETRPANTYVNFIIKF